jgi:hypothetical protein
MTGTGGHGAAPRALLLSRLAAAAAAVAVVLGVGAGLLRALAHQCLHVDGPLALLGVRLTLLQDAADCPTGTLAMTPAASQGAVLAIGVVLPVVLAHAVLGALGAGLAAVLLRAARSVRRVLGAAAPVLPRPAGSPPARRGPVPPPGPAGLVAPAVRARARHPHRGPPVALA